MLRLRSVKKDDPADTRFITSGRVVRMTYGTIVLCALLFMGYWVSRPLFFLEGPGTVQAPAISISLPYAARIKTVGVRPGQEVLAGAVLAAATRAGASETEWEITEKLHEAQRKKTEYEGRLMIAERINPESEKRVSAARRSLELLLAQKSQITNSFELSSIYREYAEAINQAAVAEADLKLMPGAVAEVGNEINSLRERLASLDRTWHHIVIAAPKGGHIGATTVTEGSAVNPGDTLMTLYDSAHRYVVWHLPAFSFSLPAVGDEVTVGYGRNHLTGIVRRVLSVADAPTADSLGSVGRLVEVDIAGEATLLPLGAEVVVRLHYF